jgi:hypothetical protein
MAFSFRFFCLTNPELHSEMYADVPVHEHDKYRGKSQLNVRHDSEMAAVEI